MWETVPMIVARMCRGGPVGCQGITVFENSGTRLSMMYNFLYYGTETKEKPGIALFLKSFIPYQRNEYL
jgi:hypothetical protein